jgi:hypothetical protein
MQERDELRALKREIKTLREIKVKKKKIYVYGKGKKGKKERKKEREERKRNGKKDMKRMNQVKDK